MWKAQRILAGTDFSKTGNAATQVALALARRMGSDVDLLHVLAPGPQPLTGYAMIDELLEPGRSRQDLQERALATLGEIATEAGAPNANCEVLAGPATETLLGQRELLDAGLLVLGAAGLSSLRGFLLGSVADRVLRRPGCPLLLVKDAPPSGEFKRILVGVEQPDHPSPWLEIALALAHHQRAEVIVLHVLPPKGYVSTEHHVELSPESVPKRLEHLAHEIDRTIPVQVTVKRGDAARVIPRVARELEADLVVLGAELNSEGWPGRVASRVAHAGLPSLLYVWPGAESDEDFLS